SGDHLLIVLDVMLPKLTVLKCCDEFAGLHGFRFCCSRPGAKTSTGLWDWRSAPTITFPSPSILVNWWRAFAPYFAGRGVPKVRVRRKSQKCCASGTSNSIPPLELCVTPANRWI